MKIPLLLIFMLFQCLIAQAQGRPDGLPSSPEDYMMKFDPVLVGTPPFRRQFLDAMVVEESDNLKRVFHAAEKYEGNPLIVKDKPWEGWGPTCSGSVIRMGNKLRMYYSTNTSDSTDTKHLCIAESEDGIHWTKPLVGEVEYKGSKKNNIVERGGYIQAVNNPVSDDKKYVSMSNKRLSWSPDGIHWKSDEVEEGKVFFTSSDVITWFYDPYENRMCATWKLSNRRHRAAGVVWSSDLKTWTKPFNGPVMVADDLDPDATQIYGMPVFAYQGMYIGLPRMYHARWLKYGRYTNPGVMFEAQIGSPCNIDVQLAWSWNLVNWTRTPERKPFIPNSPYRAFDAGLVGTVANPIVMGDEIWFYISGWDQVHEDYEGINSAIGLAKLRLDGFCSLQGGEEEGWFISRREVFNTPKITINAKCKSDGYIAAEIVDRNNNPIPGFEKYYCNAFTGNSVRGEITWKKAVFTREWIDKDKKIKFYIKNSDIYSYLPVDINLAIDDGWPD